MARPDNDPTPTEPTPEEPRHHRIFLATVRDLNRHIDHILRERQMTRRDLARLLGKHDAEVSRWFNGKHNLTLETVAKVAAALGEDLLVSPFRPPTAAHPEQAVPQVSRSASPSVPTGRSKQPNGKSRPERKRLPSLLDAPPLEQYRPARLVRVAFWLGAAHWPLV